MMQARRRLMLRGMLALAAALPIGCGKPESPGADSAADNTVRMVSMRYLSMAPLFVALDEGFFEQEGLNMEVVTVARSDAAVPPLIKGLVDVVPAAMMPSFFNVIRQGAMMKVVAGKGRHDTGSCSYSGIMVRSELLDNGTVRSPSDLAGLSAGVEPTSPSYYRYFKLLERGGLRLDDLRRVDIPMAAKIGAFREGLLDTTTVSEPWISVIESEGHARLWVASKDLLPDYQFGSLLFGQSLLEERPEIGRKFMVAYLRAVRQLNREGKTERHIDILARHTRLDRELLRKACWITIWDDARIDGQSLEEFQQWAVTEGLVREPVPVTDLVDTRFIEYANQELARRAENTP
jgi:NitT/TauT family transport system substrate-binding protein